MNNITSIIWKRKFFSIPVVNPCLYYFMRNDRVLWEEADGIAPEKFLRIPETAYLEFGGTTEEAEKALTDAGFTIVRKTDV